jgi:hypothetical protein
MTFVRTTRQGTLTEGATLNTIDLLVLTSSDESIFKLQTLFTLNKTIYLKKEVNRTELSP